ncbi:hypothetical protein JTE90_002039 [Oedothorax gibbosus]|uniref:Uncharacterized protein n=1 Tax=Oedothorax gibbosus TaxID=931172 RepID=A0AAV6UQ19_9ARAC|nr:hypothetical protein JTE90_002039 [Oedothorax gibbosus]
MHNSPTDTLHMCYNTSKVKIQQKPVGKTSTSELQCVENYNAVSRESETWNVYKSCKTIFLNLTKHHQFQLSNDQKNGPKRSNPEESVNCSKCALGER